MEIPPYQPGDEAVVSLWRQCDLVRAWNDPHKDMQQRRSSVGFNLVQEKPGGIPRFPICQYGVRLECEVGRHPLLAKEHHHLGACCSRILGEK
jgi:hypothetical protein